ncbi:MAG: hypothetical protein WBV40_11505, partial [Candidatus Cybelea sp.]
MKKTISLNGALGVPVATVLLAACNGASYAPSPLAQTPLTQAPAMQILDSSPRGRGSGPDLKYPGGNIYVTDAGNHAVKE